MTIVAGVLGLALLAPALAAADLPAVPNAEFDRGTESPAHWSLVGAGRWVDRQMVEVSGTGDDSSAWQCGDVRFAPRQLYRFDVRLRRPSGAGTAITGPAFANRDQAQLTPDWRWYGHVFRVPDQPSDQTLRVGQWHATGTIQFDAVRLAPVLPVHRRFGALELGEGETLRAGQYVFAGSFGHEGSNYHRPLVSATAWFNSDRWCFGPGNQVTYTFAPGEREMTAATVLVNVNYHTAGKCLVDVSRDGQTWQPLLVQAGVGTASGPVPAALLPSAALSVRIRADDGPANFQVNQVEFRAPVSGPAVDAVGGTVYADLETAEAELRLGDLTLGRDAQTGREGLTLTATNTGTRPLGVRLLVRDDQGEIAPEPARALSPGAAGVLRAELRGGRAGRREIAFRVATAEGPAVAGRLTVTLPDYWRADYGERLAVLPDGTPVWWCDATRKVARQRPVPEATGTAARLEAARNDYEAVQLVVRPAQPLRGLTATASPLVGPDGATIPATNIRILRVYYHFVHSPTDATGLRDEWPDALPPLDGPLDVVAGQNQPLWVLVYVPPDARPGDYSGHVSLQSAAGAVQVPLQLHVWNFALPERNHLETAFGFSPGEVFRYHGLRTDAEKRQVLDLYFQSFAEHRISPYDPAPLDPIGVKFLPQETPPRAELDFTAFDQAVSRAVRQYHFTGLILHLQGMGGGTFHERYPPKIGDFGEDTPQYQALFSSYVGQLESHLREKGWLDGAYVYWFDEPEPRDYDFVSAGMRRLKRYAPGLRRMLTEEPGDNVLAGLVDIWCPVTPNYDHARAEQRRAHGERFWWYVCCGPKAPYCTLFIDHPATELRIWHWQTWQRKIAGTLVWQTNYWTSSTAYPDAPQNPYEDPMSYVSGYGTPRGARQHWGNGDGRFLYPPLAAAVPGRSGAAPVIAPPVSSLRWEMLREGVEDYEYLHRLRELLAERGAQLPAETRPRYADLLVVPAAITQNMTTFATDPTPLYAHRRAVAEAIEGLVK